MKFSSTVKFILIVIFYSCAESDLGLITEQEQEQEIGLCRSSGGVEALSSIEITGFIKAINDFNDGAILLSAESSRGLHVFHLNDSLEIDWTIQRESQGHEIIKTANNNYLLLSDSYDEANNTIITHLTTYSQTGEEISNWNLDLKDKNRSIVSVLENNSGYIGIGLIDNKDGSHLQHIYVNQISKSGNIIWEKEIQLEHSSFASSIVPNGNSGYFILGTTVPTGAFDSFNYMIEIDGLGNQLAIDSIGQGSILGAQILRSSESNTYYIIGHKFYGDTGEDQVNLHIYNTDDGLRDTKSIETKSFQTDGGFIQNNDELLVIGFSRNLPKFYLLNFNLNGDIEWGRLYGVNQAIYDGSYGSDIIKLNNDNLLICGNVKQNGRSFLSYLRIDSNGAIIN